MALQPTLAHPSLRDRRDRKRILALQKPLSKLKPKSPSAAPDQAVQPRPAPPDRALTVAHLHHPNRGPFCAKIRGPDSTVIDTRSASTSNSTPSAALCARISRNVASIGLRARIAEAQQIKVARAAARVIEPTHHQNRALQHEAFGVG